MAGAGTVEKALDVLFHLHHSGTALGLSEIGRDLDLPKSSCHRLLASLMDRDVVEQDERGRYRPGLALLSLGLGAQAFEPVVRAARPMLENEAMELGETVFLVAHRRRKLRVLDKCEGSGFLRVAPDVGDIIPEEVTAAGRLYRVIGATGGFEPALPESANASNILDAEDEDARILERGYATNRDAWIEGLSVLAVPVWQGRAGSERELAAVLALGAASARFDGLGETRIADRLLSAASQISARLGHEPAASARLRSRSRKAASRLEEG